MTAKGGNWPLLVLEYRRHAPSQGSLDDSQERIFRAHWLQLGRRLLQFAPGASLDPELVGATVHELTYAPAVSFVAKPTAGDLVRMVLTALLAQDGGYALDNGSSAR